MAFHYTQVLSVNEITGFNMKTEFQSEINLLNAGTNQMKRPFKIFNCRTPPNLERHEITIVFRDSHTCYLQNLFLLEDI